MHQLLPYVLSFGAVLGAVLTFRWWTWFLRFQCRFSSLFLARALSACLVFGGAILVGLMGFGVMIALVLTLMGAVHLGSLLTMKLTIRELSRCIDAGSRSEDPDWRRLAIEAKPHLDQAEALRKDDAWSDAQKEALKGVRLFYDHAAGSANDVGLRDRKTGKLIGGPIARQRLGIAAGKSATITPDSDPDFEIFVQTKASGRWLKPNTTFLYRNARKR